MKPLSCLMVIGLMFAICRAADADDTSPVLAEGTPVLNAQNKWILCVQSNGAQILTYDRASISAGPIVQCRITELLAKDRWRTSCDMPFTNSIPRGEIVLITGRARTMETTNATGRGYYRGILRVNERPYERRISFEFDAGKSWERFSVPLKLDFTIPEKKGVLIFGLGWSLQMVELCDVQIYRFPADFDPQRLPTSTFTVIPR